MESLPVAFKSFQTISRRYSQVPQLRCIVQIEQFPPGYATKLRGKRSRGSRSLVIEQILGQRVSEGLNHITILSEVDNLSSG